MARSPAWPSPAKAGHHPAGGAAGENDVLLAEVGESVLEVGRNDAVVLDDEFFGGGAVTTKCRAVTSSARSAARAWKISRAMRLLTAGRRPQRDAARERRAAACLEQREDFFARRFGEMGEAIGKEHHVAVDHGVQHDAGRELFIRHQLGGIGLGVGLGSVSPMAVSAVSIASRNSRSRRGAAMAPQTHAGAAHGSGGGLDEPQARDGRQVVAGSAARPRISASARPLPRRERQQQVLGNRHVGARQELQGHAALVAQDQGLGETGADALAQGHGGEGERVRLAHEADEIGIDQCRRILRHGAGDDFAVLQQAQEERARRVEGVARGRRRARRGRGPRGRRESRSARRRARRVPRPDRNA